MARTDNRIALIGLYEALPKAQRGTIQQAANALGVPRKTLSDALAYGGMAKKPAPVEENLDVLKKRLAQAEREVARCREASLTERIIRNEIIKLRDASDGAEQPDWTISPRAGKDSPGVPTLLLSDLHWGETVFGAQVNRLNEYNLDIAQRRLRTVVEKAVELLKRYMTPAKYPGIVLAFGGDFVSGNIHEELSKTNDAPIMPVVVDIITHLARAIEILADEFGHVFIPCVTGNHGRNTKKIEAKNRNYESFDWLIYALLAKRFENDKRVRFQIADGPDVLYRVYGHAYCGTHGDQFRGGDGMIGHIGPVKRGHRKKLSRDSEVKRPWDTMWHGHFHTYSPGSRIIGNGSLVGLSEYSMRENFEFEAPQQALWMTHPKHGITYHLPVLADVNPAKERATEWVSWK